MSIHSASGAPGESLKSFAYVTRFRKVWRRRKSRRLSSPETLGWMVGVHLKLAHLFLLCLNDHSKKVNLNFIKQDNKLW